MFNNQLKRKRQLRKNSTPCEKLFWKAVRNKQLYGFIFRRQHGIGSYIVDFYCAKLKLIIEIDGDSHYFNKGIQYDLIRNNYLSSLGYTVLRYTNIDIRYNLQGVIEDIFFKLHFTPPFLPLKGEE